jgi:hypothetical protein
VQRLADGHDTAAKPPEAGVVWIDQAVPFHRSASGFAPPAESPTAVHTVADTHDTEPRTASLPEGLCERCNDHFVPFQPSTSVSVADPLE